MFSVGIVVDPFYEINTRTSAHMHNDVILNNISQSVSFLSEFIPADINLYKLLETKEVKTIAEAKPLFFRSFYRRTHIDHTFCIKGNNLFESVLNTKEKAKGIQGDIFNGMNLYQTMYPVTNGNQDVIGFLLVENSFDNLEKIDNVKNYFRHSISEKIIKTLLKAVIFENISLPFIQPSDGIIVLDNTGTINYSNHMSINIIKSIGLETLVEGTSFLDVFNEGSWKIIRSNSIYYEQELAIKDSTLNIKTFPLDNFILVLLSDITEIRNKEQEIEIKSYIIKEIHHRVKNNLQSIISLLRLQQRRNKNLEVKDILNDSIKRINSIAIVHDYLSQNNVNLVNLRDVSKNIVSGIHASFITPDKNITFKVNIPDQLYFPSSKAISFSLVLNEMLSNIIKHAFSEMDSGEVTLDIVERGKNILVTLADTGKGIPDGFSPDKNGNLGWKIISNLVKEDLKGSYLIENNYPQGAKITLIIPTYNNTN